MKVEEIMRRDVSTCSPEASLNEAARIMWEGDRGCVPVVESQGRVVGMLTDRDVCMAAYTRGARLPELSVQDAMAKQVKWCTPQTDLDEAQQMMRDAQVRRLPVVDASRRVVGVLSLVDIAAEATRRRRAKRRRTVTESSVCETLAAVSEPHRPRA